MATSSKDLKILQDKVNANRLQNEQSIGKDRRKPLEPCDHTTERESVSESKKDSKNKVSGESIETTRCIHISTLAEQVIYDATVIAYKEKLTGRYLKVHVTEITREEYLKLVPKPNRL